MNSNKINEIKNRTAPISYSNVSVNELGQLTERKSLLDERIVEGYGCIWGSRNGHGEIFTKGCFTKSINEYGPESNSNYKIKFRDDHNKPCALFAELKEDETGLYFRTVPLDDVQWANDLLTQLRSGTINNFSNGFRFIWDKVQWDDETDSLVILEARLFEISAVAIPSDLETFAMRSNDEPEYLAEDTEDFIISLPKSKQLEARKIIARNISLANQQPDAIDKRSLQKTDKPTETKAIDYDYLLKNI